MDAILENIVDYTYELTFDNLPREVVVYTKKILIDSIGCAIAGSACKEMQLLHKNILAMYSNKGNYGRGHVICSNKRTSTDLAAFINACNIRYLDYNDSFPGGHPSDMIGAILALAPSLNVSGKELIVAIVVAYEIFIRTVKATKPNKHGFDQGCAVATGTAAAFSKLLKLPKKEMAHAISIAMISNLQLRVTRSMELSMWKGCATAYAIKNAVFAVHLAQFGVFGPGHPFLGRDGLQDHFKEIFNWSLFNMKNLEFFIKKVNIKYWPVAYQMQNAVWSGISIKNNFPSETIDHIVVKANSFAVFESGSEIEKWDPKTKETADHSLPYVLAWSITHGFISSKAFTKEEYLNTDIRELMNKISVNIGEQEDVVFPEQSHMTVTVLTNTKQKTIESKNPLGHWLNPINFEQLYTKFYTLTVPILKSKKLVDNLFELLDGLDEKVEFNIKTFNVLFQHLGV